LEKRNEDEETVMSCRRCRSSLAFIGYSTLGPQRVLRTFLRRDARRSILACRTGIQKMPWHERAGFHSHARSCTVIMAMSRSMFGRDGILGVSFMIIFVHCEPPNWISTLWEFPSRDDLIGYLKFNWPPIISSPYHVFPQHHSAPACS
jgi:hypothetical protein